MIETKVTGLEKIEKSLENLGKKLNWQGTKPLFVDIGETVLESIQHTFDVEGRPKWPKLQPSTIEERKKINRWPGKILQRNAASGLLGSINYVATNKSVEVGTSKNYAQRLHFGDILPQGGILKPRPYMYIHNDAIKDIKQSIQDFLTGDLG